MFELKDELYHHGVKGQKWGVRRYQNPDGTLTSAGKKHLNKYDDKTKKGKKFVESLASEKTKKEDMSKIDKDKADQITKNFKTDSYGNYTSVTTMNVGNFKKVAVWVASDIGEEQTNSAEAVKFLNKFDSDKALEGLAKEYYDSPKSWVENDVSREEFKKKVTLVDLMIDPKHNAYEAWYDDGGLYGYHSFTDEGDMDTMKVKYRSLNG